MNSDSQTFNYFIKCTSNHSINFIYWLALGKLVSQLAQSQLGTITEDNETNRICYCIDIQNKDNV